MFTNNQRGASSSGEEDLICPCDAFEGIFCSTNCGWCQNEDFINNLNNYQQVQEEQRIAQTYHNSQVGSSETVEKDDLPQNDDNFVCEECFLEDYCFWEEYCLERAYELAEEIKHANPKWKYCTQHSGSCWKDSCVERIAEHEYYCREHRKCSASYCSNNKIGREEYCAKHTVSDANLKCKAWVEFRYYTMMSRFCDRKAITVDGYCSQHENQCKECSERVADFQYYCSEHSNSVSLSVGGEMHLPPSWAVSPWGGALL